jgi:hypothetical protein
MYFDNCGGFGNFGYKSNASLGRLDSSWKAIPVGTLPAITLPGLK